jgi:mono/diheme cytochrome c family protein
MHPHWGGSRCDAVGRRGRWLLARCWITVAWGILLLALGQRGAAQTDGAFERSTKAGVYTTEQARRGEHVYMSLCVSCHPAATQAGLSFNARWGGRPLSELYDAIRDKMPKNDPGSLTPEECAELIAYVLKLNEVSAGKAPLAGDPGELRKIRIETPSMAGKPSGGH